jgi:hypothetical protein
MSNDPIRTPTLEAIYGEETAQWMRLTPRERWAEMQRLAAWYHVMGGTSDPDPDPSSPFYAPGTSRPRPVDGRTGLRVVRRSRV